MEIESEREGLLFRQKNLLGKILSKVLLIN